MFSAPAASAAGTEPHPNAASDVRAGLQALDADPYVCVADWDRRLFSVFDDLKYDRADADMLSPAMRRHAIGRLALAGFRQRSGSVLEHRGADSRVLIPKAHALGASPFDVTRYTPKRPQDFYLLTPTQTACQIIDAYPLEEAVDRMKRLIATQPINLLKLADYLEKTPTHQDVLQAIGHLKYVQREAIASEPLCRRRALG